MNKDVKGLLKYLVIMSIIFLMPLGMVYCGLGALYYSGRTLAVIYFIYAIVLFLLYRLWHSYYRLDTLVPLHLYKELSLLVLSLALL